MIRAFKLIAAVILPIAAISGQPTGLRIVDTSAQQAIVEYTAPNANACTLGLADQSNLGVTVWDVNPIFSGSTLDLSRPDTATWNGGRDRRILLGHRSSEVASDGKFHSRSLQANVRHLLTVTCGGSATLAFSTRNIPVGNSAPDPPDFHTAGFGNAAWPTMEWSDQSQIYIDHKTGLALRPLTQPGDMTMLSTDLAFNTYYDPAGTWTNPTNSIATTGGATSAGTDPLFVGITTLPSLGISVSANNWQTLSLVGFRVRVQGHGDSRTAANRQVMACITTDSGQTCASSPQTIALNSSDSTVCFPACTTALSAPFASWGFTNLPQHNLLAPFSALVNTNGTAVSSNQPIGENSLNSGLFPTNLAVNSRVLIGNTQYPVSSVDSATALTLSESAGNQTGVTLRANTFGIKVWKTNSTGTVTVRLTYDLLYTSIPQFLIENGSSDQCSPQEASYTRDKNGNSSAAYSARLCLVEFHGLGHVLYLLRSDTGESWPVGTPFARFGDGFSNTGGYSVDFGYAPWDPSDGKVLFGRAFNEASGEHTLAKWAYRGDGRRYTAGPLPDSGVWNALPNGQSAGGTSCRGGEQTSGNLCVSILTPTTPGAQVSSYPPAANGAFGNHNFTVVGVQGNYIIIRFSRQQDAVALIAYVNRTTGVVDRYTDTMWSRSGGRFGALHTAAPLFAGGRYHMLSINPLGSRFNSGPFAGPYKSPVAAVCRAVNGAGACTNWDVNTAISNSFAVTCPATICGSEIGNALYVRIAGEPCSSAADAAEKSFYPCPWDANKGMLSGLQVGDLLGDLSQANGGAGSEELTLLSKKVNSPTDIELWVQRGADGGAQGPSTFVNSWNISPYPSHSCTSANWWFDSSDANAAVQPDSCRIISHIDVGPGPTPGSYNIADAINGKFDQPVPAGFVSSQIHYGGFGAWQGLPGDNVNWLGNDRVEYYLSMRQVKAPARELVWAADWRAYQGGNAAEGGSGTSNQGVTVTNVTAADGSTVYKLSSGLAWPYKLLPGEGWAGRHILRDISPANVTATTPWAYCVAQISSECAPGTAAGDVVFFVPGKLSASNCFTNQMEAAIPCIVPASPIGTWAVQEDLSIGGDTGYGSFTRRLTMAFNAPSRQYTFTNWRPSPDAKWGMMLTTFADGIMPVMMLARLPEWPGYDSIRRDAFLMKPIELGSGEALAEIRFGYQENGQLGQFYCTKRTEICTTTTTPTNTDPFNFINLNGHSGTTCAAGCTVKVPVLPGRTVWWQEFRSKDGGITWEGVGSPAPLMGN